MKVSWIKLTGNKWWNSIRIETPTDANSILSNEFQRSAFIAEHGDVTVIYEGASDIYRVPAFAERKAEYIKAKATEYIRARWGCE